MSTITTEEAIAKLAAEGFHREDIVTAMDSLSIAGWDGEYDEETDEQMVSEADLKALRGQLTEWGTWTAQVTDINGGGDGDEDTITLTHSGGEVRHVSVTSSEDDEPYERAVIETLPAGVRYTWLDSRF